MKQRLLSLITCAIVAGGAVGLFAFYCNIRSAKHLETPVSSAMILDTQWQTIQPEIILSTTGEWSDLLIEIPDLSLENISNKITLINGTEIKIEGYLTDNTGTKIFLNNISPVGYRNEKFLRLSNADLHWKQKDYEFHSVKLRANKRISVGRIVWLSYNPRLYKDGVVFPNQK